jgi:hypothetical protein
VQQVFCIAHRYTYTLLYCCIHVVSNADYYLADAIRDLERSWEIAPAAVGDTVDSFSGSSNSGATAGAALGSRQTTAAAAPPHHAKLRGSVYILLNVLANADNEMVSPQHQWLHVLADNRCISASASWQ